MTYEFSEMKAQNELMNKKINQVKEEYLKQEMSEQQLEQLRAKIKEAKKADEKEYGKKRVKRVAGMAAAIAGMSIILLNTSSNIAYAVEQIPIINQLLDLVIFRNYEFENERNSAQVEVSKLEITNQVENPKMKEKLENTVVDINEDIQRITNQLVEEFKAGLEEENGYHAVMVTSEVLATTPDYFTLKLLCYEGAGSGYEWNYFYTIDLKTGERLQLKDIFEEGSDYITPISEYIKEQMQAQMDADDMIYYWLNDEIEELFKRTD